MRTCCLPGTDRRGVKARRSQAGTTGEREGGGEGVNVEWGARGRGGRGGAAKSGLWEGVYREVGGALLGGGGGKKQKSGRRGGEEAEKWREGGTMEKE
ncbi:hypothetical protein Pcinc_008134 [Petrolisthes cinctipes]|uniref:Uncharacterized protein n=1 Tax=Petrolisthes cinctipes TaxID=88211 RepID=A0AAE1G772_PETCI|nr:hypothetical protein Pcinc_008134 [Petrolisthes cinctipes]